MHLQVQSGQGVANSAFIAALSDRITRFTQHLNSIKQQQRTDYVALLQEEQQLLEELAVLELTLSEEQLQQEHQHASWHSPAGQTEPVSSTADCLSRSPDRPSRPAQAASSSSPSKTPAQAAAGASTSRGLGHASADEGGWGSSGAGLPADVQAYDDFLARHGPIGGWHADDHTTFMAVLKANR
jgi:hypothetical protein